MFLAGAAWIGGAAIGCTPRPHPDAPLVATGSQPSRDERSCAWFGDVAGDTLYFGISAFWAAMGGAHGDPTADTRIPGPQWIGRFDLGRRELLAPLDVSEGSHPGGVWDVLALPSGQILFSTYFDAAGLADPATGRAPRLASLGLGLNELTLGPDGTLLATRYGFAGDGHGAVLVLDAEGGLLAEHRLREAPGTRVLAKSLAFDPARREIWVNTDLISTETRETAHDLRVLAWDGRELARWSEPEVQFMVFAEDGSGISVERKGRQLWLRRRSPGAAPGPEGGQRILLDESFPTGLDFAQDLRVEPDGTVVVTRWSGKIHLVFPDGGVRELSLPQRPGDLYYTATLRHGWVCATRCGEVQVVCEDLATAR
ncbi:MAG: hypothetical protein CL910_10085 [Deltaproteobacteria bacterium]|jgi:hypothetical protein|nr:hypothetical protein [Deltaproteobacteria bacterium]